jgi:uroporphyrin-III C-methyltransferase
MKPCVAGGLLPRQGFQECGMSQGADARSIRAQGKVFLIGAGPGDPELLTLKAARVLGLADVVLIDDLAGRGVLVHARPDARVVEVGKRGGCRSTPQSFIERLMVRVARSGRTVARVKGGDPFVFGRGGEECEALDAAGVDWEMVPGITSGVAVPAMVGIPMTHRRLVRGVTLVTGHGTGASDPDWKSLAAAGTTLVIYMGMARLAAICAALLAAGMRADMPAAVIQSGTMAEQRHVLATLETLPVRVADEGLGSPAIIVIGTVVALARAQRRDERPLERAA